MSNSQPCPTLTFVVPIQNRDRFTVEQINSIFRFSQLYPGFCEIIIVTDAAEAPIHKLAWLAIKLNQINHPHTRARMTYHTSKLGLNEIIKTGLNRAFGEKIILTLSPTQNIPTKDFNGLRKKINILRGFATTETLNEILGENFCATSPPKN